MKKKKLFVALVLLVTLANSGVLGFAFTRSKNKKSIIVNQPVAQAVVEQKVAIKTSKTRTFDESTLGKPFAEGQYKYDEVATSRTDGGGATGQLVLMSQEVSGAHFVMALSGGAALDESKLSTGWTAHALNSDAIWLPGGCASKPTQLLGGKYVFVDDGKTKATDKYGSYVFYNLQTNKYRYLGGDNFTEAQGVQESIIKVANENGDLVFYVDPHDKAGTPKDGSFSHVQGSDPGYIIRRVVDADTMHYTDYKIALLFPDAISKYTVTASSFDNTFGLYGVDASNDNVTESYSAKLVSNKLDLKKNTYDTVQTAAATPDSALELSLNDILAKSLPEFAKADPYTGSTFKTKFMVNEVGSYESYKFVTAQERYGTNYYLVPAVYNATDNSVSVATPQTVLNSSNSVTLGVY